MQEWLQPEGDRFKYAPIDTIKRILETNDVKIIVKEVGQGMGPQSLKALLSLPLEAIDFAASGGTNYNFWRCKRFFGWILLYAKTPPSFNIWSGIWLLKACHWFLCYLARIYRKTTFGSKSCQSIFNSKRIVDNG